MLSGFEIFKFFVSDHLNRCPANGNHNDSMFHAEENKAYPSPDFGRVIEWSGISVSTCPLSKVTLVVRHCYKVISKSGPHFLNFRKSLVI